MNFQQTLKNLMERQCITNYRLSKLINVSPSTIANWLNSESLPSIEKLLCISKILNVSVDYLLTGENPAPNTLAVDEQELIDGYRQCSNTGKDYIMQSVKMAQLSYSATPSKLLRKKKVSELYDEGTKGTRYVAAFGEGTHAIGNKQNNASADINKEQNNHIKN